MPDMTVVSSHDNPETYQKHPIEVFRWECSCGAQGKWHHSKSPCAPGWAAHVERGCKGQEPPPRRNTPFKTRYIRNEDWDVPGPKADRELRAAQKMRRDREDFEKLRWDALMTEEPVVPEWESPTTDGR